MKILKVIIITIVLTSSALANNFCTSPPFLSNVRIPPNILFVIDVSGSMTWSAYNPNSNRESWCTDEVHGCGWTYTGNEEGYFIPDKVYKWKDWYWEETDDTPTSCPKAYTGIDLSKSYKGSCLNFLLMSRISLLRWALTGGRPYRCDYNDSFLDPDCDPDLACPDDYCILKLHSPHISGKTMKVKVPKSRINGILQQLERQSFRPRLGILFFSRWCEKGGFWWCSKWAGIRPQKVYIGDYPDTGNGNPQNADPEHPYTYLKRFINRIKPYGGTPTAVGMWEAYDYFSQQNLHNYSYGFDISPGTYKDPMYFCSYDKSNCTAVPCAKNFVILASDGQWNAGGYSVDWTCSIDTGFENYSADPVVPAYKMHHDTLRTMTSSSNATYEIRVQQLYALGLFLGGTGEQSLKNVAMYGSYTLSHGNWPGNLSGYPTNRCKMDDCCNTNNCGKGSACTPLPPSSPDWDNDGNGIPDTFLNAKTASEIKESLLQFLRSILAQTSSGTSVSVISEKTQKGANLIQAVFHPEKTFPSGDKVTWVGFLNNFWLIRGETALAVSLREDTDQDKALSPSEDRIMEFSYEGGKLVINLYNDLDRDGICDNKDANGTCIPDATADFDTVKKIWEAGEILLNEDPNERNIWVGVDLDGNGKIDKADRFTTSVYTYLEKLKPYLETDNTTEAEKIIEYIKGTHIPGARSRIVNGKTWKLGDIIYSTPQVLDYVNPNDPAKSFSIVFVGANDGMLHAFKLGKLTFTDLTGDHIAKLCDNAASCSTIELGKEIWAFIPRNSLPYLKYLMDPNYCHLYYVDLTPFIFEAETPNGERKILIGGMRLGGACSCTSINCISAPAFECRDSSNNTVDCSTPGAIPYCVYEDGEIRKCDINGDGLYEEGVVGFSSYFAIDITDPDNPQLLWEFSDPRLGFSYSGPAVMKIKNNYYVAFGSGPTNYEGKSDQPLRIFVLKLNKTDLSIENISVIEDIEINEETTILNNAFSGRMFVYKENVNLFNPVFFGYVQEGSWKGGVLKLYPKLNNQGEPEDWHVKIVLNKVGSDTVDMGPITAKVVETEVAGEKWIIFGEGRYFTGSNDDPTAVRRIYGVKATCEDCGTELVDVTDEENGITSEYGWYIRLDGASEGYNSERMISDPLSIDTGYENISFFITFQPTSDICGYGGRTFVWVVTTTAGGILPKPEFGGKLFVQLSTGQIAALTKATSRKSKAFTGVPSETAPAFVQRFIYAIYKGKILHIIEK